MRLIDQSGFAALEMVWVIMFFLAFITVVHKFSMLASESHKLSYDLENEVEEMMLNNNRPVCLENFGEHKLNKKSSKKYFGENGISKKLTFVVRPICNED